MTKSKLLKKQKAKFLLYNLVAFFAIFLILGLIAVKSTEKYFYSDADGELRTSRELLAVVNEPGRPDGIILPPTKNPRIYFLMYFETGELIGHDLPGFLNPEDLGAPGAAEAVYNRKLEDFNFRVLEFPFELRGNTFYARILINIDGEVALRNTIITVYLVCLGAIIVLTVAASYVMSAVTMQPVIKSVEKQIRFTADASHELRTPLTVLHSRLEQLLSCPDEKIIEKSEEISDCLSEVIRLTKLSEGLLSLTKSDSGNFIGEKTGFDIFGLVNKVAVPYSDMAKCDGKTFTVSGESLTVKADAARIMQLLIILFDNALKYTNEGDGIEVTVRKVKNRCGITVADTGTGISVQGIKHVFERFYRDDASRGATGGTGLGLSIAKQIVGEHKGSICIEHNAPKGTRVSVTF